MATYVIGDVQGCLVPLKKMLDKINYQPHRDELWFTGDLVNRGPHSLQTLRFVKQLPSSTICVLGNHDLALLAIAAGVAEPSPEDTFQAVLQAPDKSALLQWLRSQPLLHHDPHFKVTLTHAGIYPGWDLAQAMALAHELEEILRGPEYISFLQNMYGNHPTVWEDTLTGWERARFITNAFTRMRFCTASGALNLTSKGNTLQHAEEIPWFEIPNRRTKQDKILFGHWAALRGQCDVPHVYPLDGGCVWGYCLFALCLETNQRFSVDC